MQSDAIPAAYRLESGTIRRMLLVTTLITAAAAGFCVFFQAAKTPLFRDAHPFLEDPYDLVGALAVPVAFVAAVLTCARAVRLRVDRTQAPKARLIRRGNLVGLGSILVTLATDLIAVVLQPAQPSRWSSMLVAGWHALLAFALVCAVAMVLVFARLRTPAAEPHLSRVEAFDDLLTLLRVPAGSASRVLPQAFVRQIGRFDAAEFCALRPWIHPRVHPWRFASCLGLTAGLDLCLAQIQQGPPPNPASGALEHFLFK